MTAGLIGGGLAVVWAFVHLFWGGRDVARPLRDDTHLPEPVRVTAWMCWHMVTATLFVMGGLILLGTLAARPDLVLAGAILAAGVAVAGIAAAPFLGVSYRVLPQGWLFVPVAAAGLWQVMA